MKKTCGKVKVQLNEKRRDVTEWTMRGQKNVESYGNSAPFELYIQHNQIPLT
jgi:hypothetical protein